MLFFIAGDLCLHVKDLSKCIRRQDLCRGSVTNNEAIPQGEDVVGVAGGEVQIVYDEYNRFTQIPVQSLQAVHDVKLMGQIKECGRFIQKEVMWRLCEEHPDPCQLFLP